MPLLVALAALVVTLLVACKSDEPKPAGTAIAPQSAAVVQGAADTPGAVQAAADTPGAEQAAADTPGAEQAAADTPGAEHATGDKPGAEQAGAVQPAGKPAVAEQGAAVHSAGKPGAGEQAAAVQSPGKPAAAEQAAAVQPAVANQPAPHRRTPKPPDDMDERMRHCPLALDGATTRVEDIAGGVRFTVTVPDATLAEVRRRAHHIVEFAARRTREGHSEFDGKGGGRMKNCPVVTDDVTIKAADVPRGAQLDVTTDAARLDQLRAETRERARKFPFAGATITVAGS